MAKYLRKYKGKSGKWVYVYQNRKGKTFTKSRANVYAGRVLKGALLVGAVGVGIAGGLALKKARYNISKSFGNETIKADFNVRGFKFETKKNKINVVTSTSGTVKSSVYGGAGKILDKFTKDIKAPHIYITKKHKSFGFKK